MNPQSATSPTAIFSQTWAKDFHVSPFNDRDGSYSLRATDPLAASQEPGIGYVRIDNTIVLRTHDTGQSKLVARIVSMDAPNDPNDLSTMALIVFLARWWWVGLATLPRILWQAQKLYLRKRLELFYRPEVTPASLGRLYTSEESALEEVFRAWLTHAVEEVVTKQPLRVIYEAAHNNSHHGNGRGESDAILQSPQFSPDRDEKENETSTLVLKILSPAFYSRFVHYAFAREAFDRECLATDERNRTLLIDNAHLLPRLLDAFDDIEASAKTHIPIPPRFVANPILSLRWRLLRAMRCPAAAASFSNNRDATSFSLASHSSTQNFPSTSTRTVQDIRGMNVFSELDTFVMHQQLYQHPRNGSSYSPSSNPSPQSQSQYPQLVLKLFLAQRYLLGIPAILSLVDLSLRVGLILLALITCEQASGIAWDVLRLPSDFAATWRGGDWWVLVSSPENLARWKATLRALAVVNPVHVWAWMKN